MGEPTGRIPVGYKLITFVLAIVVACLVVAVAILAWRVLDAPVPDPEPVIRRAFAYVRFSDPLFGVFLLADGPGDSVFAKQANRDVVVARLTEVFAAWRTRRAIMAPSPRILAELCFGLVEAALRECYARGVPAPDVEDTYVAEVARCIRAMLGMS